MTLSDHTPTQGRDLFVREKFAPLRTLGRVLPELIVFNHIPFKIGGALTQQSIIYH